MKTLLRKDNNIIISEFYENLFTITSSNFNGKFGYKKGFYIKGIENYVKDFKKLHKEILNKYKIKNYTGFFTLAKIPDHFFYQYENNIEIFTSIGISHVCFPGEICKKFGTINIIIVLYEELKVNASIDILSMASSIKSYYLCKNGLGYSTPSDAIMVSFKKGNKIEYAGPSTKIGFKISKMISNIFEDYFNKFH